MKPERRRPSAPRERQLLHDPTFDDFAEGWISYGMSMREPPNASAEYLRGREARRQEALAATIALQPQLKE